MKRTREREAVFAAVPDAVIVIDADGLVVDWNPAAEAVFGWRRADVLGRELAELVVPGALRDAHRNGLRRHLETGESTILGRRVELSALRADGTEFPVELTVTQLPDQDPPVFAGFVRDLSDRAATHRENQRLQQRTAFLAQAGLVLDRSLDYDETLRRLTELTVPELAQLAVVDVLDDDGCVRTAVAAATEPSRALEVQEMRRAHPLRRGSAHPVAGVLRTLEPVLLPVMSAEFQHTIAEGDEHYELMRRLGYHSAIVVPLVARRRALGTLSLLRMEGSPPYSQDDLVLAEELARRAALAIDNARLFEETRHIAGTLQAGLLPRRLPAIPGAQMAARFLAAAEGQEVGGDFYDAFAIGEDRWGIAIGDVCGKGPEAAALTALARYTIRALAERGPGAVLELLNESVLRDQQDGPGRYLTGVFAVASSETGVLELELAVAGHPPPLVLRADGVVEALSATGPLIGVTTPVRYLPATVELAPGDTIVLYTDGLTDARAPHTILSDSDLAELLGGAQGLGPEGVAEVLERSATQGQPARDDIAILVIRATG
ncbi:MAG: SpoIIE family protein phosphatase [Solirubrobacteraceae bacterium]